MIKIFGAEETDFSSNGDIVIKPLKCMEYKKKSLNGWYIEVEIPIKYINYIEKDKLCVIQTRSKKKPQAFRIGADTIKKTNRKISFTANHVMFDAERYFLLDVRPTNLNAAGTLEYINSRTDTKSPFKVFSNVENIDTEYFIRKNLLEAWTLIEERWQGTFDADNFDIYFMNHIGNDNGESIIYGKNMDNMIVFEDWSNVCTKICAVGNNGLLLPEVYIESEIKYPQPYTRTIEFNLELDMTTRTEEEMIIELRENAINYLNQNKYPKVSYEISSNINQSMEIGDTILVKHPLVNIETEVLEYTNDNILNKIISITFGNYSRNVKSKFDSIKTSINEVQNLVSKQEMVIKEQQILINSLNKEGYVYIDDNEILILDKLPKEQAKNVWRFGLGGIGFSSNGYEGPFKVAMTMDGQINADFITTGKLSVNIIEGLAETLDKWSKIMIDMESINLIVHNTVDITKEKESNNSKIILEDCMKGNLLEFRIKGDNNVFSQNNSILKINSENLKNETPYVIANLDKTDWHYNTGLQNCRSLILPIFGNRKYIVNKLAGSRFALGTFSEKPVDGAIANNYVSDENEGKGLLQLEITSKEDDKYLVIFFYDGSLEENLDELYNSLEIYSGLQEIDLGITDTLRIIQRLDLDEGENITEFFDEVILKNSILTLIRRIGVDDEGNSYILDEEQVFNLKTLYISLENGTNTIQVSDYENVYVYCKYVITNDYTKLFETKVEAEAMLTLLQNQINLAVTQNNVIAAIQLAIDNEKGSINMKADQFSIQSQYFTLTKDGHITATRGTIAGFELWTDVASGETRSWLTKNFTDNGNTYRSGLLIRNSYYTDFLFCGMPISSDGSWNTANAALRILNNGLIMAKWLTLNGEDGYFYINYNSNRRAMTFDIDGIRWMLDNSSNNNFALLWKGSTGMYFELYDAPKFTFRDAVHDYNNILDIVKYNPSSSSYYENLGNSIISNADLRVEGYRYDGVNYTIRIQGYEVATNASDKRLKENIEDSQDNALEKIEKLKIHSFDWKKDKHLIQGGKHINNGYIAQEVIEIDDTLVNYSKENDTYQIEVLNISALHTKAIQELNKVVKEIKNSIQN